MTRYGKYMVVMIVGALIIALTAVISACAKTKVDALNTEKVSSQETSMEAEKDETQAQTETSAVERDTKESTEKTTETTLSETTLPETEELTEDSNITPGLCSYFKHKLTVDAEKTAIYLNVRRNPSEDSEILSILFPNEVVTYLTKRGGWYEIQCDGYTGYVNADYVLTDSKAYEASKHNIGYGAMILEFETRMYNRPDTASDIILSADKGDVFRVVGVTGAFYEVEVISDIYDTLFVPIKDVILYYIFLGPGNENGLDEGTELYLGSLDLGDYETETERIFNEAEEVKESLEKVRKEQEEASRAAEEEAERKRQESIAASKEAARREAEAKAASLEAAAKEHGAGLSSATVNNVPLSSNLTAYTINLCAQYGIDPTVVFAVIYQESRFNANATSAKGAIGLMQIMSKYQTERMARLNVNNLYDPTSNILVGVDMLAEYYHYYGNWVSALTHYRYGYGDGPADYASMILGFCSMFQ